MADRNLKTRELKLQEKLNKQRIGHDLMIQSSSEIWKQLSVIENYFLLDIAQKFVVDPNWTKIREATLEIKTNTLFLPKELNEEIQKFVEFIFKELNNLQIGILQIIGTSGLTPEQQTNINALSNPKVHYELNLLIKQLQANYYLKRNELRDLINKFIEQK